MAATPRLTTGFRVSALLRRVQAAGGFATILAKGDDTAGSLAIVCREAGDEVLLTSVFGSAGRYEWVATARGAAIPQWVERARSRDRDLWIIELDVPDAARFIAESGGDD